MAEESAVERDVSSGGGSVRDQQLCAERRLGQCLHIYTRWPKSLEELQHKGITVEGGLRVPFRGPRGVLSKSVQTEVPVFLPDGVKVVCRVRDNRNRERLFPGGGVV